MRLEPETDPVATGFVAEIFAAVIAPLKFADAAVIVPVIVGLADSTIFPVPVTALDRVTPP